MTEDQTTPPDEPAVDDHLAELVARARGATAGRPELEAALDRLQELDSVDLAHHPQEFDAVHRVLREALANAGREDVGSS